MDFEITGTISDVEIIATGNSIREIARLRKFYGKGRWRKMKGFAQIMLRDKTVFQAELHWYQANGIGKKEIKIKRYLKKG